MQRTRHLHRRSLAVLSAVALILSLLPAAAAVADEHPETDDLLLTEYVEGSSLNKALELYNGTDSSIELSGYTISVYFNGKISAGTTISLPDEDLSPGDVFVVADDGAAQDILDVADQTTTSSLWNGDDAIVLFDGADEVVDSFGQRGVDPGSAWTGNGVTTANRTLRRTTTTADTDPDDGFDPSDQWAEFPKDTFDDLGTFSLDENGEPGEPPACDEEDITPIHEIQGDGFTSDFAGDPVFTPGDPVTINAVITLAEPSLDGFFVQEAPENEDDDPGTSEGLFIEGTAPDGAQAGDTVEVTGGVLEDFGRTQLLPSEQIAVCDDSPVEIEPALLELPADDVARESLENMVVETAQDLYVTSLFTAYQFGELGVAPDGPLTQPTAAFAPDDPRAEELLEENAESLLFINDRDEFGFQNAPWFHDVRRRAGDVVEAGVTGPLNYTFGNYKIEPEGEFPDIVQEQERPEAPMLEEGNDIAAFNVLNYFNTFGDSAVLRGARSQEQFDLQSAKIVEAINELDAAVLGLIELENDYEDHYDGDDETVPSVKTLVDELNADAGEDRWDWVVPEEDDLTSEGLGGGGLGTDAIAQGIIYQPERATEVGDPATFDIDAELTGEDADKNRWPFAQSFEIDGQTVTVVVNHFKSKGSSCEDISGPGFDEGDDVETELTANCNLTREYAAEQLIEWVRTKPTGVNSPDTFVVGDLNSYQQERPVELFREAGYEDAVQTRGDDAFTYKFDGRYGRLDYVLASPSAKRLLDDAEVWQANSPEPYGYLYYLDPVEGPEDATPYASSDHDPVVVSIDPPGRSASSERGGPGGPPGGRPSGPPAR